MLHLRDCKMSLPYLPECKMSAKGKCFCANLKNPPPPKKKPKISDKREYFTSKFHIHNTQSMSDSMYFYQSVSLSPYSASVFIFLVLIPNIPIPQHIISLMHCIRYTLLKPFTVMSGEVGYHAIMIHIDSVIHLYLLVYKLH
jgi:hypothetical protein